MAFLMRRIRYPATVAVVLSLLLPAIGAAQPAVPTEYQVKAAFLYNFAKFVEWQIPASPDANAVFSITFGEGRSKVYADRSRRHC